MAIDYSEALKKHETLEFKVSSWAFWYDSLNLIVIALLLIFLSYISAFKSANEIAPPLQLFLSAIFLLLFCACMFVMFKNFRKYKSDTVFCKLSKDGVTISGHKILWSDLKNISVVRAPWYYATKYGLDKAVEIKVRETIHKNPTFNFWVPCRIKKTEEAAIYTFVPPCGFSAEQVAAVIQSVRTKYGTN